MRFAIDHVEGCAHHQRRACFKRSVDRHGAAEAAATRTIRVRDGHVRHDERLPWIKTADLHHAPLTGRPRRLPAWHTDGDKVIRGCQCRSKSIIQLWIESRIHDLMHPFAWKRGKGGDNRD